MRFDFTHLALLVVVVLGLAALVVLTAVHDPVPDAITTLVTAGSGALFGITLPAARSSAATVDE
jgi:hypothetical protein